MTNDPWGQANDGSAPAGDPFGQPSTGGGSYPRVYELFGELVLIKPIKIETVPSKHNEGQMVDRLTADTVVLTGEFAGEEYDGMHWYQAPIAGAGKTAMKQGVPAILGRVLRFPTAQDKKSGTYSTKEDVEAALANWKVGQPNIRFAWALEQFTEEDANIARAYIASKEAKKNPFG